MGTHSSWGFETFSYTVDVFLCESRAFEAFFTKKDFCFCQVFFPVFSTHFQARDFAREMSAPDYVLEALEAGNVKKCASWREDQLMPTCAIWRIFHIFSFTFKYQVKDLGSKRGRSLRVSPLFGASQNFMIFHVMGGQFRGGSPPKVKWGWWHDVKL